MALKLYSPKQNANAHKALIAAEYVGVSIEFAPFQMGVTNKTPEFLSWNPIGKIPVLMTPSGPVFESNAIARYIARLGDSGLYGTSAYEAATIDQWVDFGPNELSGSLMQWGSPLFGFGPRDVEVESKAKEKVARALGALNTALASRTYLVGETVTLADIVIGCSLYYGFLGVLSPKYMEAYPHVQRYFLTLANKDKFKKVWGELKQIDETPTDVLPIEKNPFAWVLRGRAAAASAAAPSAEAKEDAPATPPQPDVAPAPQTAEAPAPKPDDAPVQQSDDAPAPQAPGTDPRTAGLTDEGEAPKPKVKNPLDLLPPSPMVLDNWKRLYSNTKAKDFREVAIKGFWDMYDPEGYSMWFCDFKHNDENTVKFITLNKVSGFLQRMDLARKYSFAKMCILGSDQGPFSIRGVWLFRGPDVPKFVQDEVYDMELYDWKKVDLTNEKEKELVNAMFEEPDDIDGVTLVEAKCFK